MDQFFGQYLLYCILWMKQIFIENNDFLIKMKFYTCLQKQSNWVNYLSKQNQESLYEIYNEKLFLLNVS